MPEKSIERAAQPVAWIWKYANGEEEVVFVDAAKVQFDPDSDDVPTKITPLYTHSRACPVGIDWCPNGAPQPVAPDLPPSVPVRFLGVDPLNPTAGAVEPMVPDSWRFGFRTHDLFDGLTFGLMDEGPFVAWDATFKPDWVNYHQGFEDGKREALEERSGAAETLKPNLPEEFTQEKSVQPAEERQALEFAEYVADGALQLIAAIQAEDAARVAWDESGAGTPEFERWMQKTDARCESVTGLHRHIYEFRKRAARAAIAPTKEQ